ncbi:MAG TPA: hypothetical protein QKA08_01315 [Candidatus Megaira endosymbiont of Nemacystus decipiens]|nr:hypothetical protein [Candidatus Megaera endosymbiont of Nemacystus decipiens]
MIYIKIICLLFLLLINDAFAVPWVPNPGTYKVFFSFVSTDKASKKLQKKRKESFLEMQQTLGNLQNTKKEIIETVNKEDRTLLNSETRHLDEIEEITESIKNSMEDAKAFNDSRSCHLGIEYGINSRSSAGVIISSNTDKRFSDDDASEKKLTSLFYKYNFYKHKNLIVTLQPKINISNRKKDVHSNFVELILEAGKSNRRKTYYASGFGVRYFPKSKIKSDIGVSFYTQQGSHFTKGFFIDNFVEYQYTKNSNKLYNKVLYIQTSLRKELYVGKKYNVINTQLGYFWKKSLVNKYYNLSGPFLSLWINV